MTENFFMLPCFVAFLAFAARRLLTFLHIFQQEEYDGRRFGDWLVAKKVFDKRVTAALIVLGALTYLLPSWIITLGVMATFAAAAYNEKDPRKSGKKALNMTARAKRIYTIALITTIILSYYIEHPLFWIVPVQALPLFLIFSTWVLKPHEQRTQQKFYNQAVKKLNTINPKIIGITGSFGKTSVKHILGHILKTAAPTLITPGSVNTVMGITRIIREQLESHHKFFVVEMGAYGPGSIATLCELTPPDLGVITAIGHAHYERFKSLETVAQAKYELAQSVINKKGMMIVHEQTLRSPTAQTMRDKYKSKFIVCGDGEESNLKITHVAQDEKGLAVDITWKGMSHTLRAPLYGLHHGQNIALAFATAATLGIPPEDIISALVTTPQITHRLELKSQSDGSFIIDDAYNSNPQGFQSALDLLKTLKKDGRAILITPGMVELGTAHDIEHQRLGEMAGNICDIGIIINADRIPTFIEGFKKTGGTKELLTYKSFAEAQDWIVRNKKPGDYILLENDLPDLYERVPKI